MACLRKILLSQAAVLAYYCVLVLIGFHVGLHHLPPYLIDSSLIGLRGCTSKIHVQNVSLVISEEATEVRVIESNQGESKDINAHMLVSSIASLGGNDAPSMEDDVFSFDVAV